MRQHTTLVLSAWTRSTIWTVRRAGSSGGSGGHGCNDFSRILATVQSPSRAEQRGDANFFDGNFVGGSPFFDASVIKDMQAKLRESLTPEMRESMSAMMESARCTSCEQPGGMMGMMAFGIGENEKGKKVARAAKLSVDLKTGKVNKDFAEEQLEPDDVALPKETVEDYSVDGATEVEFVEDQRRVADGAGYECDDTTEVILETDAADTSSGDDTNR